jgi:hypothetical protein
MAAAHAGALATGKALEEEEEEEEEEERVHRRIHLLPSRNV